MNVSKVYLMRLQGGVIYLALFISLIITIILGSLILLTYYTSRDIDNQIKKDQIISNINSGFILALSDTLIFNSIGTSQISLYEETNDSGQIFISNRLWGMYRIIGCTSKELDSGTNRFLLAGTDPESGDNYALYLTDQENFLSISGSTKLIGDCSLPKLGIRAAFIEGQNFMGDKLVDGRIALSTNYLSQIRSVMTDSIESNLGLNVSPQDSLADPGSIKNFENLFQSFANRTLTYFSSGPIILDNSNINGNIRFISGTAIYVNATFSCKDIILYAPRIYFNEEFKGSCQAFAMDTVLIGENCIFNYPSVIGLFDNPNRQSYIQIGPNTSFAGSIFLKSDLASKNKSLLQVGKEAEVTGEVYWPGTVRLNGIVYGSLSCNSFELQTFNGTYKDFLLNATIDRRSMSKYISFCCMNQKYHKGKDIKWLE